MSKANSHGKVTGSGSVNGASETAATTAGASTKHHRRPRKNLHGGGKGADRDAAVDVAGGTAGERSTVRDHAGTVVSHSQATTGQRRDHQLLCPTRVLYENTYRIEPQVRFDYSRVEALMEAALDELLKGRKYVAPDCKWLAQDLSADLLERVKNDQRDAGLRRYKFVAVVNVGSVEEYPDLQLASRCLWTPNTDAFASASFSNDSLFAVATVFAVYFE